MDPVVLGRYNETGMVGNASHRRETEKWQSVQVLASEFGLLPENKRGLQKVFQQEVMGGK